MGLDNTLTAQSRSQSGKNAARRLRAQGLLPAVYYGPNHQTQCLTLNYEEFKNAFTRSAGNRSLYSLAVEGEAPLPVLLKAAQIDPLSRRLVHLDFLRIDSQKEITVEVPLGLTGKAAGVEKGGQLQQGERKIAVSGLPGRIPALITADVTGLSLGQTMHLSQVVLPEGLKLVKTADLPVAVVAVPKGLKAEAEEASKAAAPAPAVKKDEKKK
ncbi:MAG: 50S ribosomal protein L25 [Deltaproteobacteria bacterium]|jgi:large subunit ribosomal protein L25|nr:50S ribosomal protein L25 [Deltaproteobacteria bacterium]